MKKRLKAHLEDEGIMEAMGHDGEFLKTLSELSWSLKVVEQKTEVVVKRKIWSFKMEVPKYEQMVLSGCGSAKFGIGRQDGIGVIETWLFQGKKGRSRKGAELTCNLRGDISLILSETGLAPITSNHLVSKRTAARFPADLGKIPMTGAGIANLLRGRDETALPLNGSVLQYRKNQDTIRVMPNIDLGDQIFRLGKTGVLMSFESLSFSCQGGKPEYSFWGGRLWTVRGDG